MADDVEKREPETLTFSVASRFWEELGENLVGRSPIALAELIKNGYDADARLVKVTLDPDASRIVVDDDGHGMAWDEFKGYWATVGDRHKERDQRSRICKRPLTGSKGVGRISTRVLADEIRLSTCSTRTPHVEIQATVDWRNALKLDYLTETPIECTRIVHRERQPSGTRIELRNLREPWDEDKIGDLAAELWKLQPPFPHVRPRSSKCPFRIEFHSPQGELTAVFERSVKKVLDAYEARLTGSLDNGTLTATLEFGREAPLRMELNVGDGALRHATFEIRVYKLKGRQRGGVKLKEVKDYLHEFRGVHIYDSGFRLPYYGAAEADWLGLTLAQTRRLSASDLLPKEMQTPEGLHHLPHVDHLLGAVSVDTAKEKDLAITIGRDRLKESSAFDELRTGVRAALDWYANEKARRRYKDLEQRIEAEPPSKTLEAVLEVVEDHQDAIPSATVMQLRTGLSKTLGDLKRQEQQTARRTVMLGTLATAGVAAVAYQHEMSKQILAMEGILTRVVDAVEGKPDTQLTELARVVEDVKTWLDRTKAIGGLFSHFTEAENLRRAERYSVRKTVTHVLRQVAPLTPGITFSQEIPEGLTFPSAPVADWIAILQNVIFNAANAMEDSQVKRIRFLGQARSNRSALLVQDTGTGIDVKEAERFFEPFERAGTLKPEQRSAGFGGMGLGLTIVRIIAQERGCKVAFVEPEEEFKTAFELAWRNQS